MDSVFSHRPKKVKKLKTRYRQINTLIPVPESIPLLKKMYALESRSMHGQLPIIWDRAEDFQVYDPYGNIWIDFTSTIFVSNAGHSNKRIIEALKRQLEKPLLHTYNYANLERIKYLDYLIENTPKQFEKAYMVCSGTEATEAAMKLMRLNGAKIYEQKKGVICFSGAYHGRTVGAQMMSGNILNREWIGYQDKNIFHLPFPFPWEDDVKDSEMFFNNSILSLINEKNIDPSKDICGFMLETFQGWGAVFYPQKFVDSLFKFAKKYGILVTFDEIQSGFGRTGELFGYMHYGVEPDLICLGKGVSSSLPLSVVLGSKEIMDLPEVGSMSSTHSSNPLSCVAGYENLKALLEDGLIANSRNLGVIFHEQLHMLQKKYSSVFKFVLGKGLVAAIIFIGIDGKPLSLLCSRIAEMCFQRGLLVVHTGRESIKLAPPLSINKEALIEGVNVLESCIVDAMTEHNYNH